MLLQYGPHFFSTLSEKFGQLARFFWANGLPHPLAKNFPYAYGYTETVTDRYGFYISHFSLLEMSIIIQKLLQVIFILLLVFYLGQIMGLPSPSELTGGAPKILR